MRTLSADFWTMLRCASFGRDASRDRKRFFQACFPAIQGFPRGSMRVFRVSATDLSCAALYLTIWCPRVQAIGHVSHSLVEDGCAKA